MEPSCENHGCSHARYCGNYPKHIPLTKESKKGIANSVARLVCSDWQLLSLSSLLESDGKRLEAMVRAEQTAQGFSACFRAPY